MTLKEIFGDVSSVIKEIIAASAVSPAVKADLHSKLDTVVSNASQVATGGAAIVTDEAEALPAEAGGAATVLVEKAGALAGPVGAVVADVAAPAAGAEVAKVAGQFLAVFEKHNTSLMNELSMIANNAGATTKS